MKNKWLWIIGGAAVVWWVMQANKKAKAAQIEADKKLPPIEAPDLPVDGYGRDVYTEFGVVGYWPPRGRYT